MNFIHNKNDTKSFQLSASHHGYHKILQMWAHDHICTTSLEPQSKFPVQWMDAPQMGWRRHLSWLTSRTVVTTIDTVNQIGNLKVSGDALNLLLNPSKRKPVIMTLLIWFGNCQISITCHDKRTLTTGGEILYNFYPLPDQLLPDEKSIYSWKLNHIATIINMRFIIIDLLYRTTKPHLVAGACSSSSTHEFWWKCSQNWTLCALFTCFIIIWPWPIMLLCGRLSFTLASCRMQLRLL